MWNLCYQRLLSQGIIQNFIIFIPADIQITGTFRVPTPQGKKGKWWKVIPDRENTGNLKILKKQGKHREFENVEIESSNQESVQKNNCVTSMVVFFMFKMLSFYCENTQRKLELHRENTGNFSFQDEWEPCIWHLPYCPLLYIHVLKYWISLTICKLGKGQFHKVS